MLIRNQLMVRVVLLLAVGMSDRNRELINLLISAGADNKQGRGWTCLHHLASFACVDGNKEIVNDLIKADFIKR